MKRGTVFVFCLALFCLAALSGCKPQPNADLPPDVLYERGMGVIEDYNDADLAQEFFELALAKEPDHPGAHLGMALIAEAEFEFEVALAHYEIAFQSEEEFGWERRHAAQLYATLGEKEKGEQILTQAYELTGNEIYLETELDENRLDLGSTLVTDLSPLASGEWDYLDEVRLRVPNVEDYTPISDMTHLKRLAIYECSQDDYTFLSGLTQLELLRVSESDITDLSPLSGMTNLTFLDLSYNTDLIHLDGLETLCNLSMLDLMFSSVTSVEPLSACTNLGVLYINSTKVRDLTPLSTLLKLKVLDISYLDLTSNFLPLQNCPIERLYCSGYPENEVMALAVLFPEAAIIQGDQEWGESE